MKIIGLTGGTGSGKSTVAKIMKEYGAAIIDCDEIAHENMEPGKCAYFGIVENFGDSILNADGTINRKALGNIVFNSSEKLELLNSITHPHIIESVKAEIHEYEDKKCVVVDAPLLFETGLNDLCDKVWIIYAFAYEKRMGRIMKRDNISSKDAVTRMANQENVLSFSKYADRIIENNGTLEELRECILEIMNEEELL